MKKLSTLLIALTIAGAAGAQTIPNGGFENWTSFTGFDRPDNWSTPDSILTALSTGQHTCDKVTPGTGGSTAAAKITSVTVPLVGVVPGALASGKIGLSGTTISISSGFPVSSRPEKLTGQWMYTPSGTDQGSVTVLLTKWNTALSKKDTISLTAYNLVGTVAAWTGFNIPLTYLHGDVPDTGLVILLSGKASGGTAGSTASFDDLAFTGSVPNGVTNVNSNKSEISIFPNPAANYANVAYQSPTSGSVTISVINLSGAVVAEMEYKKVRGANEFPIQVSKMAAGMYYVRIADDQGTAVRKLFVE